MNIYYVAAIWLGMALIASVVSIRIAVPAALVEIVVAELVTVVILSAFVPTVIAQQLFRPAVLDSEEEEALGEAVVR